jgi:hypothetical protein
MQIKKKTTKQIINTYDVLDLTEEQHAKVVKVLGIKPQGRPVGSTNKPKPSSVKAAKRSTAKRSAAKSIIIPPAKPHRKPVMLKCPIGGETIKAQGAYNHIVKHGKAQGMTEEQAKEAYAGIKKG